MDERPVELTELSEALDVEPPKGARERVFVGTQHRIRRGKAVRRAAVLGGAPMLAAAVALWAWLPTGMEPVAARVVRATGVMHQSGPLAENDVPAGPMHVSEGGELVLSVGDAMVSTVGPTQLELADDGLTIHEGSTVVDGRLSARGCGCDVTVDGRAEISARVEHLHVTVYAGSVVTVEPSLACRVVDLSRERGRDGQGTGEQTPEPGRIAGSTPRSEATRPTANPSLEGPPARLGALVAPLPLDPSEPEHATVADGPTGQPIGAAVEAPEGLGSRTPQEETRATGTGALDARAGQGPRAARASSSRGADSRLRRTSQQTDMGPPPSETTPSTEAPSPLSLEVRAYRAALNLRAHDADGALRGFRDVRRRWPRGALTHEVDIQIVHALVRLGRTSEARREARGFLGRHPTSPRAEDMRRIAGEGAQ